MARPFDGTRGGKLTDYSGGLHFDRLASAGPHIDLGRLSAGSLIQVSVSRIISGPWSVRNASLIFCGGWACASARDAIF